MAKRTFGVLGGMGPAATIDLMSRVLDRTPRDREQDGVRLIVDSNPAVPDRNEALLRRGASPGATLAAMALGLEAAGADAIVMACNTAHAYQGEIERATRVPFISMVEETSSVAELLAPDEVIGLLAGEGCLAANLYQDSLATRGLRCVAPEGPSLAALMTLIYAIKAGTTGPETSGQMIALARTLEDQGATLLIAACTEVPLVLKPDALRIPLLDATDVLATAIVDLATGRRQWPPRRSRAGARRL